MFDGESLRGTAEQRLDSNRPRLCAGVLVRTTGGVRPCRSKAFVINGWLWETEGVKGGHLVHLTVGR